MGDRVQNIESAIRLMKENGINVLNNSFLYETKAMYYEDQDHFLNGACEVCRLSICMARADTDQVSTVQEPLALLDTLQAIENALGRKRAIEKGPRTIDLDIILYGNERIQHARLNVPHPGLLERDFVLRPLNEYPQHTLITF